MSKLNFIEKMMESILEGTKIPKVQVERAISPIIGLFVDSILTEYFSSDEKYSGKYELIAPEFPLKKENNQSTNIDYLLINPEKKILVFLELKTDLSSFREEQAEIYFGHKSKIHENSASILSSELEEIQKASIKKEKYMYLASKCNKKYIEVMKQTKELLIVYIVPESSKKRVTQINKVDFVLVFKDLPTNIETEYSNEWHIIHKYLEQLDSVENIQIQEENISYSNIVENVYAYIQKSPTQIKPVGIRLGKLGGASRPNYQIRFDNGLVKPFRNSGQEYRVSEFKSGNLSQEYLWNDFVNQVTDEKS